MMYADSVSIHIETLKMWVDKNLRQRSNYNKRNLEQDNEH